METDAGLDVGVDVGEGAVVGSLLRAWESQQERYVPRREERFDVMLGMLRAFLGDEPAVIVDLGCGPGSFARRIVAAFPNTQVLAVDSDPVMLHLGQLHLGDCAGRLQWLRADLSRSDWPSHLPVVAVDAAVSTTALHWLGLAGLAAFSSVLAGILRPGGVFLDGEELGLNTRRGRLAEAVAQIHADEVRRSVNPASDSWEQWWVRARDLPMLGPAFVERDGLPAPAGSDATTARRSFYQATLLEAGFSEVDVVWQHWEDQVLAAVR